MKSLRNTTANPITVKDAGIIIPASTTYVIPPQDYGIWAASTDVDTYINNGTLVVNDGYDDLKIENSKRHLHEESISRPSAFVATASVLSTSNSTLTLDSSSRLLYVFTGTVAGQIVKLGNATTYNVGHKYELWNTSTQEIIIQNNSGTNIFVLAVQQKTWITLQDNSTQAGIWLIEANFMGSGSGGGNALMGFGFDGNAATGRWLESLTNVASNLTGYIIAGTKTIRSISCGASSASNSYNATFTIYKNGTVLDTISLVNSRKNTKLNLAHILTDKDEISVQQTAGSSVRPVVSLWV